MSIRVDQLHNLLDDDLSYKETTGLSPYFATSSNLFAIILDCTCCCTKNGGLLVYPSSNPPNKTPAEKKEQNTFLLQWNRETEL